MKKSLIVFNYLVILLLVSGCDNLKNKSFAIDSIQNKRILDNIELLTFLKNITSSALKPITGISYEVEHDKFIVVIAEKGNEKIILVLSENDKKWNLISQTQYNGESNFKNIDVVYNEGNMYIYTDDRRYNVIEQQLIHPYNGYSHLANCESIIEEYVDINNDQFWSIKKFSDTTYGNFTTEMTPYLRSKLESSPSNILANPKYKSFDYNNTIESLCNNWKTSNSSVSDVCDVILNFDKKKVNFILYDGLLRKHDATVVYADDSIELIVNKYKRGNDYFSPEEYLLFLKKKHTNTLYLIFANKDCISSGGWGQNIDNNDYEVKNKLVASNLVLVKAPFRKEKFILIDIANKEISLITDEVEFNSHMNQYLSNKFHDSELKFFLDDGFAINCPTDLEVNTLFLEMAKKSGNKHPTNSYVGAVNKSNYETAVLYNINVFDIASDYKGLSKNGYSKFETNYFESYKNDLKNGGYNFKEYSFNEVHALEYEFNQIDLPTKAVIFIKNQKSYLLQVGSRDNLDDKFNSFKNSFKFL